MNTTTIPKKIGIKNDLILVPRKEYEALLEFKKGKEFILTTAQKKSLIKAEDNLRRGKTLSYDKLVKKLGFRN